MTTAETTKDWLSQSPRDVERDTFLTVPEVADRLRLSQETIRRMLRDGRLAGFRIGADNAGWRVSERDLAAFVQTRIAATEAMR